MFLLVECLCYMTSATPGIGLTFIKSGAMSLVQNCIFPNNIASKISSLLLCCCLIFTSAVNSIIFKEIRDYSLLFRDGYFIWVLWFFLYFAELSIKLPSAQKAVKCFAFTFGLVGIVLFSIQNMFFIHVFYCL